ncbi:hypothetical protein KSS87_012346, partial [Heliosperma pusillum]
MGNCFSDVAVGGTAVGGGGHGGGQNDAVELFLKSRDYHGVYSQIELSLSASSVGDPDMLSKSDPMAVLYMKGRDGKLEELGRTEVVLNSPNPKWINKVGVTYHFELVQTLVFHVYDVDTQLHGVDVKMLKLDDQQFLGEAVCALSETLANVGLFFHAYHLSEHVVVTKSNRLLTLDLMEQDEVTRTPRPRNFGKLTVHAEESINSKTFIEIIFRCSELENEDLFSKSDPILMISKISESGNSIPICKTEVINDNFNPTWKPVLLNAQQAGSKDSPLTIECFNFNTNGKHDFIGKVEKSLAVFEKIHSSGIGENLVLPAAGGHDYHNKVLKSQLFVEKYSECVQHTFLDYLAVGWELNFMVAVDFT